MSEFNRGECGKGFSDQIPQLEFGDWLNEGEAFWKTMREATRSSLA